MKKEEKKKNINVDEINIEDIVEDIEIEQETEKQEEQENKKEKQKDEKKVEVKAEATKSLDDKVKFLELELIAKNQKIKALENQIADFNSNYKNELIKKASEAQVKLDEKIKEYQQKFDSELANAKKFALKDKAVDLINIINNFNNAVNMPTSNPEVQNYVKGFSMFANMFKNYLENNNIHEIAINVNDDYNPATMEAFDTEKNKEFKPNKVIKVIKKGYKLHDIVIAPALVLVSK